MECINLLKLNLPTLGLGVIAAFLVLLLSIKYARGKELFEEPVLVLLCWLIIGLSFATMFGAFDCISASEQFNSDFYAPTTSPLRYIYFSFVTLSTLGYGDYQPIEATAQLLAVVESTLGICLAACFAIATANKIQHRNTFFEMFNLIVAVRGENQLDISFQVKGKAVRLDQVSIAFYWQQKVSGTVVRSEEDHTVGTLTMERRFTHIVTSEDLRLEQLSSEHFDKASVRITTTAKIVTHIRYYELDVDVLIMLLDVLNNFNPEIPRNQQAQVWNLVKAGPLKNLP